MIRLRGHKNGDNLTILNTYYKVYESKDNKLKDVLCLIYKDNETGLKYKEEIESPEFTYYIAKMDKRVPYNRLFIPMQDATIHTAPKMELDKYVAKDLGLLDWYYDCIKSGDRRRARMIHTHPDVFGTDTQIEDLYRFEFAEQFQNPIVPVSKSYFDIEVDGINSVGDFPLPGECPINAITLFDDRTMQVYTLVLRNKTNPLIEQFEQFIKQDRFAELKQFIENHCNKEGKDLYRKYNLDKLSFNMAFYDEEKELDLITDLFKIINALKPDFIMAWNMAFDIPYIIQRIINLGGKPEEIMCHPDFEHKFAEYKIDEINKNKPAERGDYAIISSYTVFIDQLIQYASRRKGQTSEVSYRLDDIGTKVAKIHKLDYKDITQSVTLLPYKNFKVFIYYNIVDTIVQHCIESVTGDIDYTFGKSINNNTRYQKVHRQTTYLTNRGKKEFLHSDGLILGNNFNANNDPPTTKFPGAFVADPLKVSDYSRDKIHGRPINVFKNSMDFDYASLYPHLIIQYNIAANTQIGKVEILAVDPRLQLAAHRVKNRRHNEHWERSGAFFEDYHTHNWMIVGNKWFALPDVMTMVNHIKNYFTTKVQPSIEFGFDAPEGVNRLWQPIIFYEGGVAPIVFNPPINKERISEYLNYVENHPNQRF